MVNESKMTHKLFDVIVVSQKCFFGRIRGTSTWINDFRFVPKSKLRFFVSQDTNLVLENIMKKKSINTRMLRRVKQCSIDLSESRASSPSNWAVTVIYLPSACILKNRIGIVL